MVGSVDLSFTINKARLRAPISLTTTSPSVSVGTLPAGFSARNSGVRVPPPGLRGDVRVVDEHRHGPEQHGYTSTDTGNATGEEHPHG